MRAFCKMADSPEGTFRNRERGRLGEPSLFSSNAP